MRQIISLSLPAQQAVQVRRRARQRGYRNMSNYIAHLLEADTDLISEEQLLRSVRKAREEYRKGKVVHARSLDALL